jgi:quercetin dioxygenase-like cupin family protein
MRFLIGAVFTAVLVAGSMVQSLRAQDNVVYAASATSKFVNIPGLPTCVTGSVQNGDPSRGGSVIFGKGAAGCKIPWHWHTPTEQLMMVTGRANVEMKDRSAVTLRSGDYVSLPSKHVHQFTCQTACTLFIASDVAFDIHYVDASGNEIPQEQALRGKAPVKNALPNGAKTENKM